MLFLAKFLETQYAEYSLSTIKATRWWAILFKSLFVHKMDEAQSYISSTWIYLYSILQIELARQLPAKENSLKKNNQPKPVNNWKYGFVQDLPGPMAGWFPDACHLRCRTGKTWSKTPSGHQSFLPFRRQVSPNWRASKHWTSLWNGLNFPCVAENFCHHFQGKLNTSMRSQVSGNFEVFHIEINLFIFIYGLEQQTLQNRDAREIIKQLLKGSALILCKAWGSGPPVGRGDKKNVSTQINNTVHAQRPSWASEAI